MARKSNGRAGGVAKIGSKTRAAFRSRETLLSDRQASDFRKDFFDGGGYQGRPSGTALLAARDMTPTERMRAVRISRKNYKRSGVYGQIVDKLVDFTVGDGVLIDGFKSQAVEDHVRRFLESPLNQWDRKLADRWRQALIDGELLLTMTTDRRNPGEEKAVPTGLVRLGRWEPEQIRDTIVSKRDRDRLLALDVILDEGQVRVPTAEPGHHPVELTTSVQGQRVKDGTMVAVSYWAVNQLGIRGLPYLSRSLDKATMLDELVEAIARKAEYTNRFWVHATYEKGETEDENEAFEQRIEAFIANANPGEAIVTTKDVEIGVMAPDLRLPQRQILYEMVLDYILGSHGIPRMWFSSGGDTNRATAVEQGTPIHRSLLKLQEDLRGLIEDVIRYVIWIGKQAGRIPQEDDEGFLVVMSQTATRDTLRDVDEMLRLGTTLTQATLEGYIHPEDAQKIYRNVLQSKTQWEIELREDLPVARTPVDAPEAPAQLTLSREGLKYRKAIREATEIPAEFVIEIARLYEDWERPLSERLDAIRLYLHEHYGEVEGDRVLVLVARAMDWGIGHLLDTLRIEQIEEPVEEPVV